MSEAMSLSLPAGRDLSSLTTYLKLLAIFLDW